MLRATPLRLVDDMPDDAALLAAVARGDRSIAVALYDRLRPVISRAVRRVAPRSLDHADLVQQAFVELISSLRERPTVRSLDAWAATITARVVFHRLRRERLEDRFAALDEDGAMLNEVACPSADPLRLAGQREALRQLGKLLRGLDSGRMQVFLLHDVHGYELKEIAEILGLSVSNAQTRLVRGRRELHQALAPHQGLRQVLEEDE